MIDLHRGLDSNQQLLALEANALPLSYPCQGEKELIPVVGLEPTCLCGTDSKSAVYTNSTKRAKLYIRLLNIYAYMDLILGLSNLVQITQKCKLSKEKIIL